MMGKRKANLEQINGKKLRRTFRHRKDGVIKKAHELSVLCGVQVGVIIYGPNDDSTPHIWPQNLDDLHCVLKRFQNTSADKHRKIELKNMSDLIKKQDNNVNQIVEKGENQGWVDQIDMDNLSADQLRDLVGCLDAKLGIVKAKIDTINQNPVMINEVRCEEPKMKMDMAMPLNYAYPFDRGFDDSQVRESMTLKLNYDSGCYEYPFDRSFDDSDRVAKSVVMKRNYDDGCYEYPFIDFDRVAKSMGLKLNYDDGCYDGYPVEVLSFDASDQITESMVMKMNACEGVARAQEPKKGLNLAPWEKLLLGL